MTTATSPAALIETHFGTLNDPRAAYRISQRLGFANEHKLIDILTIAICATIFGANDWEAIAEYGQTKQDWLKTWLELPKGIPSPDTYQSSMRQHQTSRIAKVFHGMDGSGSRGHSRRATQH
jgi:DDE_Tnp_1-associated